MVLTVDVQVEGVHFRRNWLTRHEIGERAVATSVSDLAAMAAHPVGLLVSLVLDPGSSERDFKDLHLGIRKAARRYGLRILGGNLSEGPFSITVTAVGEERAERLLWRSGARLGDEIWVTGTPGLARLGLVCLERRLAGSSLKRLPALVVQGVRAFKLPVARVKEAIHLRQSFHPTALIDLSDGLGTDLRHVLAESTRRSGRPLGALLEEAAFLRMRKLLGLATLLGMAVTRTALKGGEDYELCLTAPPGPFQARKAHAFKAKFKVPLSRIGWIVDEPGIWLRTETGSRREVTEHGWEHF